MVHYFSEVQSTLPQIAFLDRKHQRSVNKANINKDDYCWRRLRRTTDGEKNMPFFQGALLMHDMAVMSYRSFFQKYERLKFQSNFLVYQEKKGQYVSLSFCLDFINLE